MIQATIDYLGQRGRDKVTNFTGTVTSVCFDLYGCVQVVLTPDVDKKNAKATDGGWYDINRVELLSEDRRMPVPQAFSEADAAPGTYEKGPAAKSLPHSN